MGISIKEGYRLSPRQFQNISKGYINKKSADYVVAYLLRDIASMYYNRNREKGKPSVKPERFFKFPWEREKKKVITTLTPEELDYANKVLGIKNIINPIKNGG